jgi:hypothetical protein
MVWQMLSTSPFVEFIQESIKSRFSTPGGQTNEIQLNEVSSFELQTLSVQQSAPAVLQHSATYGAQGNDTQPTLTPTALEPTATPPSPAESVTPDTADVDQEALVFAEFIHHLLRDDVYVKQSLPADSTSSQLCAACRNGIIPWCVAASRLRFSWHPGGAFRYVLMHLSLVKALGLTRVRMFDQTGTCPAECVLERVPDCPVAVHGRRGGAHSCMPACLTNVPTACPSDAC